VLATNLKFLRKQPNAAASVPGRELLSIESPAATTRPPAASSSESGPGAGAASSLEQRYGHLLPVRATTFSTVLGDRQYM
jgi:hypothetical protein